MEVRKFDPYSEYAKILKEQDILEFSRQLIHYTPSETLTKFKRENLQEYERCRSLAGLPENRTSQLLREHAEKHTPRLTPRELFVRSKHSREECDKYFRTGELDIRKLRESDPTAYEEIVDAHRSYRDRPKQYAPSLIADGRTA